MKRASLFLALLLTVSCAALTKCNVDAERHEFLNKLPMLNNEILGALKYDNPDLDLKTLGIMKYSELYNKADLTDDYKDVIDFINDYAPDNRFCIQTDTFIICLRSEEYSLILCDDAETPMVDNVHVGIPIPTFDTFCAEHLDKACNLESK